MARPRHPNKEIELALQHAESEGWEIKTSNGHAWGRMFCPGGGCIASIWSTPKNPTNHARQLRRVVDRCRCEDEQEEDET